MKRFLIFTAAVLLNACSGVVAPHKHDPGIRLNAEIERVEKAVLSILEGQQMIIYPQDPSATIVAHAPETGESVYVWLNTEGEGTQLRTLTRFAPFGSTRQQDWSWTLIKSLRSLLENQPASA